MKTFEIIDIFVDVELVNPLIDEINELKKSIYLGREKCYITKYIIQNIKNESLYNRYIDVNDNELELLLNNSMKKHFTKIQEVLVSECELGIHIEIDLKRK